MSFIKLVLKTCSGGKTNNRQKMKFEKTIVSNEKKSKQRLVLMYAQISVLMQIQGNTFISCRFMVNIILLNIFRNSKRFCIGIRKTIWREYYLFSDKSISVLFSASKLFYRLWRLASFASCINSTVTKR